MVNKKTLPWLILAGLLLLVHAWSLLRYPAPFVDEAWLIARAWGFIQSGHPFGPLDMGLAEIFPGYWVVNQWLITALQSLVLRFFPTPQLLPLRIFSLVIGAGLLAINFKTTHFWGGKRLALLSTLLLALSQSFFHSAHLVRYDILAALFGYTGLALVICDSKLNPWRGLCAGILLGLAVETHLNSLIFYPAVGVLYFLRTKGKFWKVSGFWAFAGGCAIGAFYYLAIHVLPYPQTYFQLNSLLFSASHQPALLSLSPLKILQEAESTACLLLAASGSMIILPLVAIPILVRKKESAGIEILWLNVALILFATLLIPNKIGHYAIYLAPAFLWLVAIFLQDFLQKPWHGKIQDYFSRVIVWGCVAGAISLSLTALIANPYPYYQKAQSEINAVIQPTDTILGTQVYWLGLTSHTYYSWELLFRYPVFFPGNSLADTIQHYHPDIMIIDQPMEYLIVDFVDPSSRWATYHLPRQEFYQYLSTHAKLILETHDFNGPVRVYRFQSNQ